MLSSGNIPYWYVRLHDHRNLFCYMRSRTSQTRYRARRAMQLAGTSAGERITRLNADQVPILACAITKNVVSVTTVANTASELKAFDFLAAQFIPRLCRQASQLRRCS